MWNFNEKGEKEFAGSKEDWAEAVKLAKACSNFKIDVEDELITEEPVSCYNCRYRRWSLKSFTCLKTS